jgi:hypothetical protein
MDEDLLVADAVVIGMIGSALKDPRRGFISMVSAHRGPRPSTA